MADWGSTPGPTSDEDEGTENVGGPNQPMDLTYVDDPSEGFESGPPGSEFSPIGEPCLSLLLTPPKIIGSIPMLYLSNTDAHLLMGDNMVSDYLLGPFSVDLRMVVDKDRTYSMNLSCKVHPGGRSAIFILNSNWGTFLRAYDLRVGDTVHFYRSSEAEGYNFILKFYKQPRLTTAEALTLTSSESPKLNIMHPKEDNLCFSKILYERALAAPEPALYLDSYEALSLTGSYEVLEPHSERYWFNIIAYDELGVCYDLLLSCSATVGPWEGYCITQDWGEFVSLYDLQIGDEVKFYKCSSQGRPYCLITFVRKPLDRVVTEVEVTGKRPSGKQDGWAGRKKKAGPGSRVISDDQPMCFSTFLSADEVGSGGETPKLAMDAYRAGYMIACYDVGIKYPLGKLRENLVVYDIDDRKYDMLLTHRLKNGNLVYYLDAGWQRFVEVHCLRAGDVISMFKFVDSTVQDEPFFVIRFRKMGDGGKAGPGGDGGEKVQGCRG